MNKLFVGILLCSSLLVACSSSKDDYKEENGSQNVVEISKLTNSDFSALPDIVPTMVTTATIKSASADITLKNSSTTVSYNLITVETSGQGFSIKTNRCGAVMAPKATCKITVQFLNRGLFDNTYNGGLLINEGVISLSASVSGQPDPDGSGTPELSVSLDSPFDPIGAVPYRTLSIKNIGTGTAKDVLALIPSSYSLRLSRCPANLKPQQSCEMQVLLKNARSVTTPPSEEISIGATGLPPVVVSSTGGSTNPPVAVDLVKLYMNNEFAFALMSNGTFKTWGSGTYSQEYVDGLNFQSLSPIKKVFTDNFNAVAAVLLNNGMVKVWGNQSNGGDQAQVDALGFSASNMVKDFYTNGSTMVALLTDGTAKVWGSTNAGRGSQAEFDAITTPIKAIYPANVGYVCVLEDDHIRFVGNISLMEYRPQSNFDPLVVKKVFLSRNGANNVAVLDDGTIRSWGSFGNFTPTISSPVKFGVSGYNTTVIALENNQVLVFGTQISQSAIDAVNFPSLSPIKKMVMNGNNGLAILLEDNTVKVFGDQNFGGNQSQVNAIDFPSKGSLIRDIFPVEGGIVAVLQDKRVFAWGNASYGASQSQIDAINFPSLAPIKSISSNLQGAVLALLEDGKIQAWGGSGLSNQAIVPAEFK